MIQSWEKKEERPEQVGFRKLVHKVFRVPDGRDVEYTIVEDGRTASVLAITKEGQIIVAKQFRPGPEKILKELPGGFVEKDEDPKEAARRELLEETGYEGVFVSGCTSYQSAYSSLIRHGFLVRDCVKVQEPKMDKDEWVEIELLTPEEFRMLVRSGEMTDTGTAYRLLEAAGI